MPYLADDYHTSVGYSRLLSMESCWRVFMFAEDIADFRVRNRFFGYVLQNEIYSETVRQLVSLAEMKAGGIVAQVQTESWLYWVRNAAEAEANVNLCRAALAASAFKSDKGQYPSGLSELVPQYLAGVPVDPFDGKPLRWIAVEDGAIIYSVGEDGDDDGGKEIDRSTPISKADPDVDPWRARIFDGDLIFCLGSAYEERRAKPQRQRVARRRAREKARKAGLAKMRQTLKATGAVAPGEE